MLGGLCACRRVSRSTDLRGRVSMPQWLQLDPGSYRILADATYDWESWITEDGVLRWVNPAVYRFTGFSVAECHAMDDYPLPLVHPDDRREFSSLLAAGMAGSTANDVEVRLLHRNGSTVYAAASWQPVRIERMPIGLRVSVRDISSRKEVEHALKVSEALYRSIVESAWEGIWLLDAAGRIEFVNVRMVELLGKGDGSLRGQSLEDLLYDDAARHTWHELPRERGTTQRQELLLRRADGAPLRVLLTTSPRFDAEGKFAGLLVMVVNAAVRLHDADVEDTGPATASTRRLAQLGERDRHLQRLTDLGKLAAQVSHEINNPLASVRNALRLLQDLPAEDEPTRREFHQLIDQEIERISRIVQQMGDLQRPAVSLATRFDLQQELQSLVMLLRPTAELRQVVLEIAESPTAYVTLPADELRQILFNILTNAIEVSPPQGRIIVALHSDDQQRVIAIQDEGPGIAPEDRPRLFEPFFTKKPRSSTANHGLGLAVCYALAQSIGVEIEVRSEPGHGAEFRVVIPHHPATEA